MLAVGGGHRRCHRVPDRRDAGAEALHALVGEPITPVLTCDRYSTYAKARIDKLVGRIFAGISSR
ncbi:hypothetical protein P12x_001134 [Tundrisphaera lichenicola]|uniref:hypothetical protein n=1 Tax=Tundrisphaera lichenicola TaxID=2029860 RepID=UPI003EBB7ACA